MRKDKIKIIQRDGFGCLNLYEEGAYDWDYEEKIQEYSIHALAKEIIQKLNEFIDKHPDAILDTESLCEVWFTTNKGDGERHEVGIVVEP